VELWRVDGEELLMEDSVTGNVCVQELLDESWYGKAEAVSGRDGCSRRVNFLHTLKKNHGIKSP